MLCKNNTCISLLNQDVPPAFLGCKTLFHCRSPSVPRPRPASAEQRRVGSLLRQRSNFRRVGILLELTEMSLGRKSPNLLLQHFHVGETFEFPDRLVMFDLIAFAPKHDLSFYIGERGYFIRICVSQLQCPHRDFKIFSCFVNRAKSWKNDQTNQATFSSKNPKFLVGWHQPR